MLITPIRAAGLLLILASIASGEPDIDAPAEQMDPADLLRTFQRRANVKRHMAESRKRSYWPLRSRSRRSQTGSDVNKEKTFNPEKAPPRFFHASKFATADTNATQPVNGSNSTAPLVDSQDGKPFFRSGRTSQSRGSDRQILSYLATNLATTQGCRNSAYKPRTLGIC